MQLTKKNPRVPLSSILAPLTQGQHTLQRGTPILQTSILPTGRSPSESFLTHLFLLAASHPVDQQIFEHPRNLSSHLPLHCFHPGLNHHLLTTAMVGDQFPLLSSICSLERPERYSSVSNNITPFLCFRPSQSFLDKAKPQVARPNPHLRLMRF